MIKLWLKTLKRKARQSPCRFKVSAIGFNAKGDYLGSACNLPRFCRKGGGLHAEMFLMRKYGSRVKTIIICRCNDKGKLLPIHPCEACSAVAIKEGIEIKTVEVTK